LLFIAVGLHELARQAALLLLLLLLPGVGDDEALVLRDGAWDD
jgi:hypothetical protein